MTYCVFLKWHMHLTFWSFCDLFYYLLPMSIGHTDIQKIKTQNCLFFLGGQEHRFTKSWNSASQQPKGNFLCFMVTKLGLNNQSHSNWQSVAECNFEVANAAIWGWEEIQLIYPPSVHPLPETGYAITILDQMSNF